MPSSRMVASMNLSARKTSVEASASADFTTTNVAPQRKDTATIASSARHRCQAEALTRRPVPRA